MEPLARSASHWVELRPRILSAIVMALIVGVACELGGIVFNALVMFVVLLMGKEWDKLTRSMGNRWRLAGYVYIILPCASFIWLRSVQFIPAALSEQDMAYDAIYQYVIAGYGRDGLFLTLYLIATVALTDVGAFFAGRHIGGPRLAPRISPNKTWAGLIGGMIAAGAVSCLFTSFFIFPGNLMVALWMGLLIAAVAQAGDLFESWLKRRAGVKDSGTLIPGHGGILDRIDGYAFAAPLLVVLVLLFGGTRL